MSEFDPSPGSWRAFMEGIGPNSPTFVSDLVEMVPPAGYWKISGSDLLIYCDSPLCGRPQAFKLISFRDDVAPGYQRDFLLEYECRNCQGSMKTFAVRVAPSKETASGTATKYGEIPPFGPPTPPRVISLIGHDRELFLLGRRAENHGFGIGAFAYYRRVVENQKGHLIAEIGKVAARLDPNADLELFKRAAKETQFTRAIDLIKDAIPPSLRIDSHNPLTLLHKALSEGLHAQTDADCLEYAQDIRIVLTALAERISEALKEQSELSKAVSRLLSRGQNHPASTIETI